MTGDRKDSTTADGARVASPAERLPTDRISVVLYHGDGVIVLDLADGATLEVGRSSDCHAALDHKLLSRRHAQFSRRDDAVEVVDLESRNGTFINGERVTKALLPPGTVVMLGDPHRGVASVVERVPGSAPRPPALLDYEAFCAELESVVDGASTREDETALALLMLRACTERPEANLNRWAAGLLGRLDRYHAAGVCDSQTLLLLLRGEGPDRARTLAAKLLLALDPWSLRCGIACLPGAAGSAEELLHHARRACFAAAAGQPVVVAEPDLEYAAAADDSVVIQSEAMSELYRIVHRVAPTDVTVLILGETGTGKEVVANTLHRLSARADQPFRTVNCAAIPASLLESTLFGHEKGAFTGAVQSVKGVFEQADGGTIFLDEIGELSPALQAALLRVLESKCITRVGSQRELQLDVRIIAATHRELERMADQDHFRRDLWFRLSALELSVPPLRERDAEIVPLAHHFLQLANTRFRAAVAGIEVDAVGRLRRYAWPGNVRELRNVIERAVLLARGPRLTVDDLPERVRAVSGAAGASSIPPVQGTYQDLIRDYEIRLITEGLRIAEGNQTRAAQLLKIPLRTLAYKLRQYGIKGRG